MKIILQKPVAKLGVPGDLVEVADGYARNFLMPRGLAIPASKGAVKHAESLRRAHTQRVAKGRAEAEALAADAYASADQAAVRIETRLRRYKRWRKDRQRRWASTRA